VRSGPPPWPPADPCRWEATAGRPPLIRETMGHRFTNLDPSRRPPGWRAILRWGVVDRLLGRRQRPPAGPPAPRVDPDLPLITDPSAGPRLTWIGHASFLLSLDGANLLVDPTFSHRAGLVYRRYGAPGLAIDQLPRVDAILLTHSHHDHLDARTLARLQGVPAIVPSGVARFLGGRDVVELGWWRETTVGGVRITLVPACHWSRRRLLDTNHMLWGGFVVEGGGVSVYQSGDSAFFEGFAEVGRRFPGLTVAALPIGGYAPVWFMKDNHMTPEQTGRAFLACGARTLVPMHWGAFRLSDEPLCEPIDRLRAWWDREGPRDGRRLAVMAVGETLRLGAG
jgi:L-ascorbate metabolism protein UlaG (beta-lactamase superfamily)